MRPYPINRRKPAVVSVRSVRSNGMTVLITYRAMRGPIQVEGSQAVANFPLTVTGAVDPESGEGVAANIIGWRQLTANTVEVTFNVLVRGLPYEYADQHPYYLAYGDVPIAGKRGTVG